MFVILLRVKPRTMGPLMMAKVEMTMKPPVVNHPVPKTAVKILRSPVMIPATARRGKYWSRTLRNGSDKGANRSRQASYVAVFLLILTTRLAP